ncbi:nuclease-related domain-containing protein [Acinetobacter sp. P1(2025)]|uniref:nuclease-related domain-containing protein n=1 Tax=Acinetobacter sp. P1(2025) TaxID=3446120 RepID=UPI003F52EE81
MDLLTVFIIVLVVIAFILIGVLNGKYKRIEQGRKGEAIVTKKLNFWLKSSSSHVLNDITIPTSSGTTTQIDHLVISTRGIFCIETKNLNGTIYGNKDDQNWKHFNRRGDKNNMFNPLKQNRGHINNIARILRISPDEIQGFVVNVGSAKLKGDIKPFFSKPLIETGTGFIFKLWRLPKNAISQDQVDSYLNQIQSVALERSRKTNKQHISNIKKRYK